MVNLSPLDNKAINNIDNDLSLSDKADGNLYKREEKQIENRFGLSRSEEVKNIKRNKGALKAENSRIEDRDFVEDKESYAMKEQAMLQFMASLENEFQVPKSKVLGVMAQLEVSPELLQEMIPEVGKQLPLVETDIPKARMYYNKMLKSVGQVDKAIELDRKINQSSGGALPVGATESASFLQKQIQMNSLDMNKGEITQNNTDTQRLNAELGANFLNEGPIGGSENGAARTVSSQVEHAEESSLMNGPQPKDMSKILDHMEKELNVPRNFYDIPQKKFVSGQEFFNKSSDNSVLGNFDKLSADSSTMGNGNGNGQGQVNLMSEQSLGQFNQEGETLEQQMSQSLNNDLSEKMSSLEEGADESSSFESFMEQGSKQTSLRSSNSSGATSQIKSLDGASLDQARMSDAENVQKIMSQAKVLVRAGGGEMSIRMSPEGMGEVALKVAMENGKVNIKMMADNIEAKRVLESNLSDLRTNLEGQQLKVEDIQVSTSKEMSEESLGERGADAQNQENREQAHRFLENFRDGNLFQREGFADDFPEDKKVASEKKSDNVAPVDAVRTSDGQSGRRLNVVG